MSIESQKYGFCPICGAAGASRERRPNGNDECIKGHTYASRDSVIHEGEALYIRAKVKLFAEDGKILKSLLDRMKNPKGDYSDLFTEQGED